MSTFYIPLRQHVGSSCEPVVKVGERIERGQLLAVPKGLGAKIHSSISGEIARINEEELVITVDKEQTCDYLPIPQSDSYLQDIENAGIVGAGGAGFPTKVKLDVTIPEDGCFIANAVECEALLGHNIEQIKKSADQLIRGMKYVMEITKAPKAYIALKDKNRQAVIELLKRTKDEKDIEVFRLPDIYPAGDERMVIREILGMVLKPGQLPIEIGVVVDNVETIKRITEAIEDRKPFIDKDVTVAGRIKDESHIFMDVPIGTPARVLIDEAGGYIEPHGEIVIGGPMTGRSGSEATPVTKTAGGILVAMPFPQEHRKVGILICECGGSKERLTEVVNQMGAEVVASEMCKRMVEVNGRYRCELPGICPGQAEKVMKMKNEGAEVIVTGTCSD